LIKQKEDLKLANTKRS